LVLHGHIGAVVQVDLSRRKPAATDTMLETLEVFCGELAVALENAMLRGAAHRTAILQEKNRIAQELHDTVLQMLFGVGLRLQWSLEQLPADSALREPLEEARHLSARAGGELRGAIFTLCSDIAEIGLVPAVERLVREQAARAGWAANVVVRGAVPELPVLVQNAAHRVVREALMNAYKHARATEVVVSLRFTPAALTVVVQDNGVGIPAEALAGFRQTPDHFGLRTVAEQVESLGGELAVYNNDEQGAALKAVLPLALPASEPA
jgi:signal transduction histidine kinase